MKQFTKPEFNLKSESSDKSYCELVVEPLERGFGTTLGNALRRTLISSTSGAAVFAIKLRGASHEFTSIPGIIENVSRIILNIKQLVLSMDTGVFEDDEVVELKLNSSASGEVKASSIEVPAGVEILSKDLTICTIADKGSVELTLYAKNSRGYKTFKDNKREKLTVDAISIDSNYSPIISVSYEVEPTKIGKTIDLEKLKLIIKTDGSVTATDAASMASKILMGHLELFANLNEEIMNLSVIGAVSDEDEKELDRLIDDLDFTQRSLNCLKRANINILRDLVSRSEDEIQEIRNLGRKSFKEIKEKVAQLGLTFKQN